MRGICLIIIIILCVISEKVTEDFRNTSLIGLNIIFDLIRAYRKTKKTFYLILFILNIVFITLLLILLFF